MTDMRLSLLDEPIFGMTIDSEVLQLSLPDVLAVLADRRDAEPSALQAHQGHAWHAFLVQVAASALHGARQQDPWREAARWRDALLGLTDGDPAPWSLVVDDLSKPAFVQPPVPEGTMKDLKHRESTPDAIDVLVTSKNHDVKQARIVAPRAEHWAYALVSVQTMGGYAGSGNRGIARMNGGYSSRPAVALAPDVHWPSRFRRDLAALIASRDQVVADHGYQAERGLLLLWRLPWTGSESEALALSACDPYFIECCRRIRLEFDGDTIIARRGATKADRVAGKEMRGDTGDLWTPIHRSGKALSVGSSGWHYPLVQDLLFPGGEYAPAPSLAVRSDDEERLVWIAEVLARGQGTTAGFRERLVPVPGRVRRLLGKPLQRQRLGDMARGRVDLADDVRRRALRPALLMLLYGPGKDPDRKNKRPGRWTDRYDDMIDRCFFEALWADVDLSPEEAQSKWAARAVDAGWIVLEGAFREAPLPAASALRHEAAAEGLFWGVVRKHWPTAASSRRSTG